MTTENRGHDVVIERALRKPPEDVWSMWTDPQHFAAWYGPAGASITVMTMDVRVGGKRLLRMDVMTGAGPMQMWFTGEYLAVVEYRQLVFTDAMSDEHGNVLSSEEAGMPGHHPSITEVRVELERVAGGTKMILTHVGIPAGSPGEAGWTMALDKLASYLNGQPSEA